jgi:hypothetical protein
MVSSARWVVDARRRVVSKHSCTTPHEILEIGASRLRDCDEGVGASSRAWHDESIEPRLQPAACSARGEASDVVHDKHDARTTPKRSLVSEADDQRSRPITQRRDKLLIRDPKQPRSAVPDGRTDPRIARKRCGQHVGHISWTTDFEWERQRALPQLLAEHQSLAADPGELTRYLKRVDDDE